ncbi:TRAP transporter substrate-binding protein [uncultured Croceitalea sp.]|uniref:TRAP transporter substrate-binding protein n=1 Tax=uncultured Croceitalea sp. TaxID=1798908 RepID=UPI00374FBF08
MQKTLNLKYVKTLVILLTALVLSNCTSQQKSRTLKIAHGLDSNHPVHKAMEKMGEDLDSLSDGKLLVKIYPSQQLGSERECLELLQLGSLDMTKVSVGVLENFAPKMKVLGLPYLFRNKEHTFKVLDGPIGKQLLNEGEKYLLKGLCYYDAGNRSFYTKTRPIRKPEDLEGLKIRVMESATAIDMVKRFGGSPTPISSGELYTALQQGVVDGAENNPPTFYLSKQYEVCKYFSLDEHTVIPDVLVAGKHLWDKLTKEEQEWLDKAIKNSVTYQRKLWAASEEEALEAVSKAGVEIIHLEKDRFSKKVTEMYTSYKKDDEEIYKLIQKIKAVK